VGILDRISAEMHEKRYSADSYVSEYIQPFMYGGNQYFGGGNGLVQTLAGNRASEIVNTLPGYAAALRQCPPAFAAELIRAMVLSQARFTFRNLPSARTPRRAFGTSALGILERPWPNATTGELIARCEWHAGLAGNAFVFRQAKRLRVLRPDWVAILYGSDQEPEDAAHALDGELIGYVYGNGGLWGGGNRPQTILPADMAHWSPIPDPEAAGVGMSWITPAVRDMQGDRLAAEHKIRFFENGATPNLVVKGIPAATKQQFDDIVAMMEDNHAGVANAYKTLYLTAGADATVVGANLAELDLKGVQGANETRIASLSRVHPVILGIAEGLAGSSLNAGNFGMARRIWADTWIYPSLQDLAAALSTIVDVPRDAELWFDVADMPILREDAKDAADIQQVQATTITSYVREGFTWESAIAAAKAQDVGLLKHTGNLSIQLQPPGAGDQSAAVELEASEAGLTAAQIGAIEAAIAAGFDPASAIAAVEKNDVTKLKFVGAPAGGTPGAPGTPADSTTVPGRQEDLDWGLFGGNGGTGAGSAPTPSPQLAPGGAGVQPVTAPAGA
jgi:phage portal protein BeeE